MMKMKKFLMLLTVAAIALMCFTGCGSAKITGITLDEITLEKGESVTLNAEFVADKADIDAETLNKAIEKLGVTFTVADESIAALDGTTLIALAAGETTVTVSSADGALSATAKVVVQAVVEGIEAEDILLNTADEIAAVEYTLLPEGAKAEKMEFAVADESVVTVKDGDLVVVAAGETELTITADGVEKTVTVTVQQAPEKLTVEDMELEVGATADIIVDTGLEDVEAEVGTEYTYTSADENTATVDENGVVTGVAAGETTITVENELGQKTDCKVVVTEPVRQTTSRPAGNNGGNGNTGNGSNTGAATPNQPSGGNGGGSTPAPTPDPTPAPQPDPTPAPDPTPDVPPAGGNNETWGDGGAAGKDGGTIIPGGGTDEGNGGNAAPDDGDYSGGL